MKISVSGNWGRMNCWETQPGRCVDIGWHETMELIFEDDE